MLLDLILGGITFLLSAIILIWRIREELDEINKEKRSGSTYQQKEE